jgi:hypothetical protein
MMKVLMVALLMIGSICPTAFSQNTKPTTSPDDNRQEAERLWELAIAAKGGRERLYSVKNLQVSIREKVRYLIRRLPFIEEDLYVFPGKSWEWNDQRPAIFGFGVDIYNHDQDIRFWYIDHGKGGSYGKDSASDSIYGNGSLIHLYDIQLRYFMETKWVRPIPVSVQKGKVGRKSVDVVQTIVKGYPTRDGKNEKRIAFALDQKTHLPLQVIYKTVTFGQEYTGAVPLSDYVDINGIQMPSKEYGLKTTYQFNVDYDEQIFLREPNIAAGILQWMKK